jgi:hypothetical protein
MADAGIVRASQRVTLACRALSAAVNDMAVARRRDQMPVDDTAQELEIELERVCELAQELERRAERLGVLTGV